MERARSRVLKEEQDSKEREALLDKIKDDVTLVKEEMVLAREKISAPSTNETSPETLSRVPSTSVNAANKPVRIPQKVCLLAHPKRDPLTRNMNHRRSTTDLCSRRPPTTI
jgi:hypothetical protein